MTILTKYNDKEVTEEQLEALAASLLAQMIEYYKNVSSKVVYHISRNLSTL